MSDTATQSFENVVVIGARTLIGRRLRELAPGATFASRRPLAGISVILDTAHPEDFTPDRPFDSVIMCAPIWLLTPQLLDRLADLGMKRLVAFSSTSIFTKDDSTEAAERAVAKDLLAGEKAVMEVCPARGVAWTILRPTLIYDEGKDENVSRIASMVRKLGFFPVCRPASGLRQPVHACDLARAALQVQSARVTFDKSYNLSGGESLAYRVMVERVFAALGRKPLILPLGEGVWRFLFRVKGMFQPGQQLRNNINMVLRMNRDLWFDHTPAARDFGYAPRPFRPEFTDAV